MANVTVNSFVLPGYHYGGATATIRLYASLMWTDSAGTPHVGGSHEKWYQDIACTVAGTVVTVPQFVTQSTLDALDYPTVTITAVLFDHLGARRQVLFSGWSIPTTTPTTWAALKIFNMAQSLVLPPDFYLNRQQVIDLISSLLASATQGIVSEVPAGVIDGVNGTFTLSSTPVLGSQLVFLNGILQQEGNLGAGTESYTISGATITHFLPPQPGDRLFVVYRTASGLLGNLTATVEGVGALVAGTTTTILSAAVAANSAIECISKGDGIIGNLRVSNRVVATSFDVESSEGDDAGNFKWILYT